MDREELIKAGDLAFDSNVKNIIALLPDYYVYVCIRRKTSTGIPEVVNDCSSEFVQYFDELEHAKDYFNLLKNM